MFFLLWYFAIKDKDYAIKFKTKALPGEIVYRIKSPICDKMEINSSEILDHESEILGRHRILNNTRDKKAKNINSVLFSYC